MNRRTRGTDGGFTLIEVLVVTIILGILAAIAIPVYLGHRAKAIEAGEKSDARSIAVQMESSFTDSLGYPTTLTLVGAGADGGGRVVFSTADPLDTEEYVPLSPHNTAAVYLSEDAQSYCIVVDSSATQRPAVYDSAAGGLLPAGTVGCGVGFDVVNLVG